jgi:hypothetical protein
MIDTQNAAPTPKRLRFFTILCVVAVMVNGFSLIKNAMTYMNPQDEATLLVQQVKENKAKAQGYAIDSASQKSVANMEQALDNLQGNCTPAIIQKISVYGGISAFICLLGISLMWQFKSRGFHLFIIGTIIGTLAPFFLLGSSWFSLAIAVFSSIFWLIFIGLFGSNLKYMD